MASDWGLVLCLILRKLTRFCVVAALVLWAGRGLGVAGGRPIPVITPCSSSWHITWSSSISLLKVLALGSSMPSYDFSLWHPASRARTARQADKLITSTDLITLYTTLNEWHGWLVNQDYCWLRLHNIVTKSLTAVRSARLRLYRL